MSVSLSPNISSEIINISPLDAGGEEMSVYNGANSPDKIFELGLWLSGLQSFLKIGNYTFAENKKSKALGREWTNDFYLTHSTLLTCSRLALQLIEAAKKHSDADSEEGVTEHADAPPLNLEEISDLAVDFKNLISINHALLRSKPLEFSEWLAWSNLLADKLQQSEIVRNIIEAAEEESERHLPQAFQDLLQTHAIPFAAESDLRIILPRIAKILCRLDVIEDMLVRDAPLKSTQLLFSKIYEQTQEMITHINNRLLRFGDENNRVFEALDCAVYAASIELRKVYKVELAGWSEIGNAPRLFAKTETAHSLLSNSFRQTLVNLAQVIDPSIEAEMLFPAFRIKLEQSLALRAGLWQVQCAVQYAEHHPETLPSAELNELLTDFTASEMNYLMTKDCETFERFVEEIVRTATPNDLVPTLHRFGAYVETLLGQVNMRAVLADKPFDYPKYDFS